jgi:hypothetical protein
MENNMDNNKRVFYTIKGKVDGFGSQYQAVMSGIAFCESNDHIYLHTPFAKMDHSLNVDELNKFIGVNNDKLISNNLLPTTNDNIIAQHNNDIVHYEKKPSIFYTDKTMKIIKDFYYSNEKPQLDNIDIAIHIRRGDVDEKLWHRYTENKIYINIINSLKKKYPNYNIIIFSEGNIDDFKDFNLEEKNFKLNVEIKETFHSLVKAKILVTSKSSFSYTAALLNENTVYYMDFWHKALDNWLDVTSLIE